VARTTAAQARAEIVGTARHLFGERGYEGTSLQDIATALGGSKAGVLYHFGSKALILRELMLPAAESFAKLVDELDRLDADLAQRRAVEGFVGMVLEYRDELSAYPAAIQQVIELPELDYLQFRSMGERLVLAMTGGSTETVDLLAAHVACIGLLATTTTLSGLDTGAPDPQARAESAPAAVLVGLGPEELRRDLIRVAERTLGLGPADR
jgi:AcrR family transcriptional regulator